ncbi:MAG TPA: class I SAM-dependent methyltransferase [Candidatus Woesebacteria bacterium]|nr:class I SAM-dependent methyltransferase [Candidatus Woesebacteria bacterium]
MKASTINHLNKINQQFYEAEAQSFSQTRRAPWAGWNRLLAQLEQIENNPIKVLDIGCGNGRFGQFLSANVDRQIEYTGTDNSRELLKIARNNNPNAVGKTFKFIYQDLIEELLTNQVFTQSNDHYDLIVLFGVLHHIPSFELRHKLLSLLNNLLSPNGLLVFTVWRFGELGRFKNKLANPKKYNINPTELEPGDYLVDWRDKSVRQTSPVTDKKSVSVRYAHAVSKTEIEKLTDGLPPIVESYLADGQDNQTNQYIVIKQV